jgi:hypothetical protein
MTMSMPFNSRQLGNDNFGLFIIDSNYIIFTRSGKTFTIKRIVHSKYIVPFLHSFI